MLRDRELAWRAALPKAAQSRYSLKARRKFAPRDVDDSAGGTRGPFAVGGAEVRSMDDGPHEEILPSLVDAFVRGRKAGGRNRPPAPRCASCNSYFGTVPKGDNRTSAATPEEQV